MPLSPGTRLGRYEVVRLLGAGGMGEVYLANDERLQREVALKVLPAGTLADEAARRRFRKEAQALARLDHANIATIHDFDSHQGVDFLVMEYVPGDGLDAKLARGPLPEREIVRLAVQLVEGLAAAHSRGIIHRDLKPGNLRVTGDGRLKILDFGLAKLMPTTDDAEATETITAPRSSVAGTPPYMAPEQLRGEGIDPRTDIYAVGAVLYEMATGRRPFGQERGPLLFDAILHQAPVAPGTLNRNLSTALESIILRALEKDPEDRYRTAPDLLADLAKPESPWSHAPSRPRSRPGFRATALIGSVGLGALIVIGLYLILGLTEGINSIAVLPFINSERDPEVEYLSDGITETIINTISRLPDVKVIARASVFHYKGRDVDPRTVGRELDVRAVLAGRVVRRGENLVISAELIDTRDNRQIWGERYNRGFSDILETQEEIALRISENLSIRLSGEEKEALAKRHTRDTEAYDLYLRGRYHMQAYDQASLTKAQEYFERAIEIDPSYALSYVGIAESYYYLSNVFIHPHEAMPNARTAALKALEIDPNLAEAHAALAVVSATYGWDWETAERAYKRALKLKPSHAQTHQWYGHFLIAMGRPREALAELRSASELDPLSTVTAWVAVWPYVYAPPEERQYDAAIREIENILETDPNFFPAHNLLALVYEQQNQFVHAIDELQRSVELAGEAMTSSIALLGHAYALSGDRTKAERALNRLLEIRKEQHTSTFFIALLYLGLDDPDRAIDWLERAYENRDEDLIYSSVDPRLDTLRADARFSDLLRRMGLDR